jgi:TPR repeat protein
MTTEYPMARKEKKPVLPALLVPTDKSLLSEKYEDIPECTDAHNSIALSDALLAAVQKMAIKENDNSPEHNFFIGLAYLSGIDVEVDHERARKLIGSSAEAGLLEAQKKLVSMYVSGDGVERSFEKAAKWNKRVG